MKPEKNLTVENRIIREISIPLSVVSLISGGIAGSVGKTITAPMSRLTVLYQVGPILQSYKLQKSSCNVNIQLSDSIYQNLSRIIRQEGVLSLWNGNLTTVLHRFPYSAINFSSFEWCKAFCVNELGMRETPFTRLICGAVAGGIACASCYPLDLIKTRLTVNNKVFDTGQPSSFKFLNTLCRSKICKTAWIIVQEDGIRGLYRGLSVSLLVTIPSLAISFSTYGTLKEYILDKVTLRNTVLINYRKEMALSPIGSLLCGSISGVISSMIMFPVDTIRRRMQISGMVTAPSNSTHLVKKSTTTMECILEIWQTCGLRGFYRGIFPELLKVAPMVSVTFCVYEIVLNYLTSSLQCKN